MGLRSRLRGLSSSGRRSPSPQPPSQSPSQPPTFGPLPPNLPETIVLNITQPAPTITILTQAIDANPVFQIDYSSSIFVTHIPTSQPVGSVTIGANNNLTINQPATNTSITYRDTLTPPPWFKGMHGNKLFWDNPACNEWQAALLCEIIDGLDHPNDEEDVALAVILDSKLQKGRIDIRKRMSKEEMDFLLLSALAEIEDLKGKVKVQLAQAAVPSAAVPSAAVPSAAVPSAAVPSAAVPSGGGKASATQYLQVMNQAVHLSNHAMAASNNYGGDSGGYGGDSGGGGGGGGDSSGGGGGF